jgi:DUF4097 and DUF4098 domain-containing protein YvlB
MYARRSIQFLSLLLLMVPTLAGGCATRAAWDDETHLRVTTPIEIEVDSFGGDVTITTTDKWPEVRVRVRRAAVHGHLREKEAAESLEQVTYTAEMTTGEMGPKLVIRTMTEHPEAHFQRAHVFIDVPRAENISVRTARGDVTLTGVSGQINVETTDGEVRLLTNRALDKPITILNQRGDIHLRTRGESKGYFDCEAVRGEVSRRIRYGYLTAEPGSRHDRFRGSFNGGDNPITLRTVDGNIRISVVHNPEQVGTLIFD